MQQGYTGSPQRQPPVAPAVAVDTGYVPGYVTSSYPYQDAEEGKHGGHGGDDNVDSVQRSSGHFPRHQDTQPRDGVVSLTFSSMRSRVSV